MSNIDKGVANMDETLPMYSVGDIVLMVMPTQVWSGTGSGNFHFSHMPWNGFVIE
jgi:hypothetical protein